MELRKLYDCNSDRLADRRQKEPADVLVEAYMLFPRYQKTTDASKERFIVNNNNCILVSSDNRLFLFSFFSRRSKLPYIHLR
jgi:hypothetical protein